MQHTVDNVVKGMLYPPIYKASAYIMCERAKPPQLFSTTSSSSSAGHAVTLIELGLWHALSTLSSWTQQHNCQANTHACMFRSSYVCKQMYTVSIE